MGDLMQKTPLPPSDNVFERIQVWPSVLSAAAEQGVVMADHAGFHETSLLLAARPELVEMDRLGMAAPWYCTTNDSKARKASVEEGEQMFQIIVNAWVEKLLLLVHPKSPTPNDMTVSGLF